MKIGKCLYCKDGEIEVAQREVKGKKVKLYTCSNAHWYSEDKEMYELREDATCSFRLWENSLARYGKWLQTKEVQELLAKESIEVELVSQKGKDKKTYKKQIALNLKYGVSVLW